MKFFGSELKFNNKRVYHENDKPSPSEIGAAAESHAQDYSGTAQSDSVFISYPKGGQFRTNVSTLTGYLKIQLPQSWTSTMMRMTIDIYEYSSDRSCSFVVGGYNYSGSNGTWANSPFAYSLANKKSTRKNLAVRLGHDGNKCAIYIGEADTVWSYPQVSVKDITLGFGNYSLAQWSEGWNVSFTTTLGSISATITEPWANENTWRPVENILTSTSTVNSLSAAQGKVLKDLIDTKAPAEHGNHIPNPQSPNDASYLRNDNTWSIITPDKIGAAIKNHAHDDLSTSYKKILGLRQHSNESSQGHFNPFYFALRQGKMIYTDEEFALGNNSVNQYNNSGGNGVLITRIDLDDAPNKTKKALRFSHNGSATYPNYGGFYQSINSRSNGLFVQVFKAKIPKGYRLVTASNSIGNYSSDYILSDDKGTGRWETYIRVAQCGADGSFSSGGHVSLADGPAPTADNPLVWFMASCTIFDLTDLTRMTPGDIGAAPAEHGIHVIYGGNGGATTVSRSDHSHAYLPLSGGIVTGEVTLNSYLKLNAWPGYGTGTINIWANKNGSGTLDIDGATDINVGDNLVYHQGRKPTYSEIGAAPANHGNHVPSPQSANDSVYLRNDNTWQQITPSKIGASSTSLRKDNYIRITVDGDKDTYYPVRINDGSSGMAFETLHISRRYNWAAPDTWYTATHRGGLTLGIRWTGDSSWGGNYKGLEVTSFAENYSTMVAGIQLSTGGLIVWLRGGGALYQLENSYGSALTATVHIEPYNAADGKIYSPRVDVSAVNSEINSRYSNRAGLLYDNNSRVYSEGRKPSPADLGAAPADHGIHVIYGGDGSASTVSRSDHSHNYISSGGGTITGPITKNGSGAGFLVANGNARTMIYGSSAIGEHIFGGNNNGSNEPVDYIRVGSNKLQFQTNGVVSNIYHSNNKPTPSEIGAAPASHGNHIPNPQGANGAIFLRNDNNWATVTPENIGAAIPALQSLRDFTKGSLIKTSIPGSNGVPFLLKIQGNSYGGGTPFNVMVQGYQYSNTIINYSAISLSGNTNIPTVTAFNVNGELWFWFPRHSYWQGITVQAYNVGGATRGQDYVYSITDEDMPVSGVSRKMDITVKTVYSPDNKPSASDIGAAPANHGNHIPNPQSADNKIFLRNDNTWQTITPANIGAANSSHEHSNYISGRNSTGVNTTSDLNLLWQSGFYEISGGSNTPSNASWHWVLNIGHTSNSANYRYGTQIAGGNSTNTFFMRNRNVNGEGTWCELYHTNNKPSLSDIGAAPASHEHSYLPLAGGTISGVVKLEGGHYASNANASGGVAGYLLIASIQVRSAYQNQPFCFSVFQRGRAIGNVELAFINSSSSDPNINIFNCDNSAVEVYIVKTSTSNWDIYIKKAESYDNISIHDFKKGIYLSGTDFTWKNIFSATLPDGAIKATNRIASIDTNGNASSASTLQTTRTINGTGFNGSGNIVTSYWGTSRVLTIGNTGRSVDGSGAVTWTLADIGAASTAVATSSSNGLMSSTDKAKVDTIGDIVSYTKSIMLTTEWQDFGVSGTDLETGSYMIQIGSTSAAITSQYNEIYTGTMSWYNGATNSTDYDEILLHKAGHASNNRMIYLRTIRSVSSGRLRLQIAFNATTTSATNITISFRKMM